jgi:hypothetical protein
MPPRIKFDALITIEDWSDALRKILDAAVKATEDKDAEGRQDLMDLLLTFIKRSPAKVELLDVIAREAIEDLSLAEISESLQRISSRSAELNRAVGLIDAVTVEAKKDARKLQLESTLDALAKAKAAIDALNKIEKAVADPDQNLLDKLRASADAIAAATKAIGPQDGVPA